MARLFYLNRRGHTEVAWDVERARAGEAEALAAVEEAQRLLEEALGSGYMAFAVQAGVVSGRIGTISSLRGGEDIMLVPPMAGG